MDGETACDDDVIHGRGLLVNGIQDGLLLIVELQLGGVADYTSVFARGRLD